MSNTQEPFGYFKAEPFGWTDCAETDEGAQPMWDNNAMCAIEKQRDDALTAKAQYQTLLADMTERCHDAEKQRDELLAALSAEHGGDNYEPECELCHLVDKVKGGA